MSALAERRHVLERQVFTTSRLSEFCSQKELTAQTGHPVEQWPLVILKELVDNALDACEEADTAPEIQITVNTVTGIITIADNGPGIPAETVKSLLDFTVRVSSREAYVSPTRGAQGNALKTVLAMAFALDGSVGETVIEAHGIRHVIRFTVNGITREPEIEHVQEDGLVRNGTSVTVRWPPSTCLELDSVKARFLQIAEDYTCFNPHLALETDWDGEQEIIAATDPNWRKWRPSDPTSAPWYDIDRLERLAGAYVAKDRGRTVREFIADFRGMSSTGKQKSVLDATGLSRTPLLDLFPADKPDRDRFANLLRCLKTETKPVKPQDLGVIGLENLNIIAGSDPEFFNYKRIFIDFDGIPAVVEVAFAYCEENSHRVMISGVNWSVGIINPFRDLGGGWSLGAVLEGLSAGPDEPIVVIVHVAYPCVSYTDRGKSALSLPPLIATEIRNALTIVTKAWTKQRKREDRQASAKANRDRFLYRQHRAKGSQKDVVLENLDAVIAEVSGDGRYRFNSRQLLYRLRPIVMRALNEELKVGNLVGIITDYEAENGEIARMYREPRGSIYHPHDKKTIVLGTLTVETYERPFWTFNKLVYIEKEGANEALKEVTWGERHDRAILSSKGFSSRAARDLVDKLASHDEPVTIYCVHDANSYGSVIYQTFQIATKARGARKISITNLGLEPWEAITMGLEVEDVEVSRRRRPVADYVKARDDEAPDGSSWEEWLQTHRVELNAMTTPEFIAWLDRKMAEHGTGKLIPPRNILQVSLAERLRARLRADITARILREAGIDAQVTETLGAIDQPDGAALAAGVKALFDREPHRAWRDHIDAQVEALAKRAKRKQKAQKASGA